MVPKSLKIAVHQRPELGFLASWTLVCLSLGAWSMRVAGPMWLMGTFIFFSYFAPRLFPRSQRFGPIRCRLDSEAGRAVALTFDDGPGPSTGAILDLLRRWEIRATFFVIGEQARRYPDLVNRIKKEGHHLGNHTDTHQNLLWRDPAPEIRGCQEAVGQITGEAPTLFRPPFGYKDQRVLDTATALGLETVNWSVNPLDFFEPTPEELKSRVFQNLEPGSIILLHDGPGPRPATVDALEPLLQALVEAGYDFQNL